MRGAIEVWQPRYHDRKVLVARYRIPCGANIIVHIKKGAYQGYYGITNQVICHSPTELMTTKQGKKISMRAIDLEEMVRISDEEATAN